MATLKRENFHSQKAVFKLGQQQRLGTCPPPPLDQSGILLGNDQAQGPFTWRTGSLNYKNPIYFQWLTAELRFQGREGD